MKKFLLTIFAFVILASAVLVPISASAATKEDVLNEFKTVPASHYIYDDMVQLANNHPLTSEQYDKLLEYCKEFKAAFPEDKGPSFDMYDPVAQDRMLKIMDKVCALLNLTYEIKPSENPKHTGDDVIFVYDANGKLIYRYDGDELRKTDVAETPSYTLYALISASLIVVAVAVFGFISKKRKNNKLAA